MLKKLFGGSRKSTSSKAREGHDPKHDDTHAPPSSDTHGQLEQRGREGPCKESTAARGGTDASSQAEAARRRRPNNMSAQDLLKTYPSWSQQPIPGLGVRATKQLYVTTALKGQHHPPVTHFPHPDFYNHPSAADPTSPPSSGSSSAALASLDVSSRRANSLRSSKGGGDDTICPQASDTESSTCSPLSPMMASRACSNGSDTKNGSNLVVGSVAPPLGQVPTTLSTEHVLNLNSGGGLAVAHSATSHLLQISSSSLHSEGLTCTLCKCPILDKTYKRSKANSDVYHHACFLRNCLPECRICSQQIKPDEDGHVRFNVHSVFPDKYCPWHDLSAIPSCSGCTRVQPQHYRYHRVADARSLCLDCFGSAALDTQHTQSLYLKVLEFFHRHNFRHPAKLPMYLVPQDALDRLAASHGKCDTGLDGLCVTHEATVTTMLLAAEAIPLPSENQVQVDTVEAALTKIPGCPITAILVLYGYPSWRTGSIIARECMRAFLRCSQLETLDPLVEECVCRLVALLWLQDSSKNHSEAKSYWKLDDKAFHAHIPEQSQRYADIQRNVFAAYEDKGLQDVVERVRVTGRFARGSNLKCVFH